MNNYKFYPTKCLCAFSLNSHFSPVTNSPSTSENDSEILDSEHVSTLRALLSNSETPQIRPSQEQGGSIILPSPNSPRTSVVPRRLLLPVMRSNLSVNNCQSVASAISSNSTSQSNSVAVIITNPQGTLGGSQSQQLMFTRSRSRSRDDESNLSTPPTSPIMHRANSPLKKKTSSKGKSLKDTNSKSRARTARMENDSMVYLDGPQIYTCAHCRTHLTSHDDIISKSFHGRHGRAYLFDQCVNVTIGPPEDRNLMTGMHSVCDIFCKRCKNMVGWTYARAYEPSQKYKEGKFIIEKINLHMEESDYYDVSFPAGERRDRWRIRSMSWGSDKISASPSQRYDGDVVYEYKPSTASSSLSPYSPSRSVKAKDTVAKACRSAGNAS